MICDSPFWVLPKAGFEKVPVPCGRCPPCKMRRVNSWVFRLLQEQKVAVSSHFITLTYDTRFVPISDNGFMTLKKSDYQNFMKRLRKLWYQKYPDSPPIKYYACGEYGTQNLRPHYHAIIFNLVDESLVADAWALGGEMLGQIHIGQVTGDSIAYTMKYIDKPKQPRRHARDDRVSEFALMSKRLGANYLTPEMVDYHKADLARLYATKDGGHRIGLPRYYRNKIYTEQEQKKQVEIIQDLGERQEIVARSEFDRLGYPAYYTYEQYVSDQKYHRYKTFYHIQKDRNL